MDVLNNSRHRTRILLTSVSASVVVVFLLVGALYADQAAGTFGDWLATSLFALKWYYVALVAFVLFFVLWLGFGRYKNVRLGRDTDVPEFRWLSWFSMLFAAGMGIGLNFWSVSEPLSHYQSNPFAGEGLTPEAASTALRLTFFHWGLHAWAVYALVGLCLGYFAFRRDLPLTIRSVLYPVFGERIYGPIGHLADVFAVFGTAFGVATSLGLGIQQIATGLGLVTGLQVSTTIQLGILAAVTLAATVSAVSGVR